MSTLADDFTRHPSLPDPTAPLTPSGNLRRRVLVSRTVDVVATAAAVFAVAMLIQVAYTVIHKGAPVISWAFLTQNAAGLAGGGIANDIVGTAVIVAFGAVIALPIGILTGLYLTEFAGPRSRAARGLKLVLDLLQGLPTVVVGVVIVGLVVTSMHKETGLAASIALAIIMLPLIARSSQEVLLLVPNNLREAADALGVERWRAVVGIILPAAAGGIATGAILSIARAAGETAPVLLVNSLFRPGSLQLNLFGAGVPNIPIYIFTTYDLPVPSAISLAWGAALVLLTGILLANIGARVLLARSRRKMGL